MKNNIQMDIVEFAEKFCGVKLLNWQKDLLRKIQDLPPNTKIIVDRRGNWHFVEDTDKKEI